MCCYDNRLEKWVISLVMIGVLFSLAVAVPMILISYPGDECLLFVSVRGEALIYGHPAGCTFISASHCIVAFSSIVFSIILISCRCRGTRMEPSKSGSIRSLRGSVTGASTVSFGRNAKPTVSLIIFAMINYMFVLINAIVILSGYIVTCGGSSMKQEDNYISRLHLDLLPPHTSLVSAYIGIQTFIHDFIMTMFSLPEIGGDHTEQIVTAVHTYGLAVMNICSMFQQVWSYHWPVAGYPASSGSSSQCY